MLPLVSRLTDQEQAFGVSDASLFLSTPSENQCRLVYPLLPATDHRLSPTLYNVHLGQTKGVVH